MIRKYIKVRRFSIIFNISVKKQKNEKNWDNYHKRIIRINNNNN